MFYCFNSDGSGALVNTGFSVRIQQNKLVSDFDQRQPNYELFPFTWRVRQNSLVLSFEIGKLFDHYSYEARAILRSGDNVFEGRSQNTPKSGTKIQLPTHTGEGNSVGMIVRGARVTVPMRWTIKRSESLIGYTQAHRAVTRNQPVLELMEQKTGSVLPLKRADISSSAVIAAARNDQAFWEKHRETIHKEMVKEREEDRKRLEIRQREDTKQFVAELNNQAKLYHEAEEGAIQVIITTDDPSQPIHLELYPKVAPKTVARFLELIKGGIYDNASIIRRPTGHNYTVITGTSDKNEAANKLGLTEENPALQLDTPEHNKLPIISHSLVASKSRFTLRDGTPAWGIFYLNWAEDNWRDDAYVFGLVIGQGDPIGISKIVKIKVEHLNN